MSSCCPESCACQDWLTTFCDYITISHRYCGQDTVFEKARGKGIPSESARADAGVNPADRIFEFSSLEQDAESGVGARITDENDQEWIVYKVEKIRSFCLTRVWGRNIESCFALLGKIDVFEVVPCDTDCGEAEEMRQIGRLKGNILTSGGTQQYQNDSDSMVVEYSATIAGWSFGVHPKPSHRLRHNGTTYRISRFTDSGPFLPYALTLEKVDDAQCQN